MKKTLRTILALYCMAMITFAQASVDQLPDTQFAAYLKSVIIKNDQVAFRQLLVKHEDDTNFMDHQLMVVFDHEKGHIRQFLTAHKTLNFIRPLSESDGTKPAVYMITYYDPNIIDFRKPVTNKMLTEHWSEGFVETQIVRQEDKWVFINPAFYFSKAPPWTLLDPPPWIDYYYQQLAEAAP